MTTVATIRDLNNRYPTAVRNRVLVCPACEGRYSGDLARYWCPEDRQRFGCPDCDRDDLWLRFEPSDDLPIAQRYPGRNPQ